MKGEMMDYFVTIPIAGSIVIPVNAKDKAGAIKKAWALIDKHGTESGELQCELQWNYLERIVSGNVIHAPVNEITVDPAGKVARCV
jgi:glycine cleavage system regulatory protein